MTTAMLIWVWVSCAAACAVDCYKYLNKKDDSTSANIGATVAAAIIGPVLFPFFIFRVLMSLKVRT